MIALLSMLALAAPVAVPISDARDDLPWSVSVVAGAGVGASAGPCGPRRVLAGVKNGAMLPVPTTTAATTTTWLVPLHWQPGLFGLDGDLFVVAAESALRAARVEATVTLSWQAKAASLAISTSSPASTVAAALAALSIDGRQYTALLQAANARRAWRHARVGVAAIEQVDGAMCFPGVAFTPASTTATAATIRAALAGPVRAG